MRPPTKGNIMNRFTPLARRNMIALDFNSEWFDEILKKSYGEAEMSDADIKLAVLAIHTAIGYHRELIKEIIELLAQEPKKKFWQFWK